MKKKVGGNWKMILKKEILILVFASILIPVFGIDTGFEITKECRTNLTMLKEASEKYLKDGNLNLPTWDKFENVYTMNLTGKYIPQKPKKPTLDCEYFIVFKNPEIYDWYCNIHGVVGGDKTLTFRYHEFQFTARVNSKYMDIQKYKLHNDNLLRWCNYVPTLMEDIKFQYARNPFKTIILVVIGLIAVWFVYRNVFAP